MDRLLSRHSGGRPQQVTPRQKKRVGELREAGPWVVGCATACGHSVLIRVLIWRAFGVLSHRHEVCTLRPNRGFSFPQAPVVSEHLDAAKRLAWLQDTGPAMGRTATRGTGFLRCAAEARLAQRGA